MTADRPAGRLLVTVDDDGTGLPTGFDVAGSTSLGLSIVRTLVESELGSDWARKVSPSFDGRRAVLFDDRWASVREDFARVWVGDDSARDHSFVGLDEAAQAQARWWLDRARREQRTDLVSFYGSAISAADGEQEWGDDVAVVTGAAPGSIERGPMAATGGVSRSATASAGAYVPSALRMRSSPPPSMIRRTVLSMSAAARLKYVCRICRSGRSAPRGANPCRTG